MESTLLIAAGGILLGALALSLSVERLLRRLGVQPENPDDRSRGFGDVLQRLDRWRQARERDDR